MRQRAQRTFVGCPKGRRSKFSIERCGKQDPFGFSDPFFGCLHPRIDYRFVGWWSLGLTRGGFSLLISGLLFFRAALSRLDRTPSPLIRAVDLAKRGVGRRAGRSLVTVGAMAAGAFLVVSTGAFRKQTPKSVGEPGSGTGGFAFLGETASPLYDDLNGMEGQTLYDLDAVFSRQGGASPDSGRRRYELLNLNKALIAFVWD